MKPRPLPYLLPLLAALLLLPGRAEAELFQHLSYGQALEQAAAQDKLVLLDYFTTWCVPCKQMDATTWLDPRVIAWVEDRAVAIRLDAEVEVERAKAHNIETFPTTLLLRADGSEIDRLSGYKTTDQLLGELSTGLSGKDAVARARDAMEADPVDLRRHMSYAKALADRGWLAQSLIEYLYCFDAPVADQPQFRGIRASFLLMQLERLAQRYPPAREALETRRKRIELAVLGGSHEDAGEEALDDLLLAYQNLSQRLDGDHHRALDLLDRVAAQGDRLANTQLALARAISQALLADRRYETLLTIADPEAKLEAAQRRLDEQLERLGPSAQEKADPSLIGSYRQYVLALGLDSFEILLGVGQNGRALAVAEQLVALDSTAETLTHLAERARQAGDPATAEQLEARAASASETTSPG